MDVMKIKWKKNMISRVWEKCCSFQKRKSNVLTKSKSWHGTDTRSLSEQKKKRQAVAPEGCFSVYVGPERQRFVVKAEFANHPLFQMLLEDAETEYGFSSEGPILLPCDVDLFYKVLAEMDSGEEINTPLCTFAKGYSLLVLRSPRRQNFSNNEAGYGSYRILSPSRSLKLNP
ncbi:hypothetical protein SLEP1_g3677 [Rubroshorea leprosula]|uniref:Small auxin up regulated protein n=1 Tax=Rubroshorea leprosula TaxID=152421 RepID=A0AAV5HTS9_9ROSI|nr:hypothetical protein SLEP1_g3677 [Rubroshorea leprosula]